MPIGQKHHQSVTVAVAVGLGCLDQLLDLVGGQMLARAQLSVWRRRGATVRFSMVGVTSRRFGFVMIYALPAIATVQTLGIF
jgi:hypothetical protein